MRAGPGSRLGRRGAPLDAGERQALDAAARADAKPMSERALLRLAGTLLVGGLLLEVVAEIFHPSRQDPNDHPAVFAEYAQSKDWIAVHFGQFAAILVGI